MEDYVKVYKKYPPYKEWLKTYKPPVRTESQKKIIKERFREKLKKELDNLVQKSTEDYILFLKWNEIKELQGGTKKKFSNKDINWVKKLIWKPKDSKNYRGDFRRIYPELILCGNDFEVAGKDIFNNDVTFDYGEKDDLTLHWNILRAIVSRARNDGVVGRQFRYLVRDRDTKKYLGIICISSDMIDTSQRNQRIGLPKNFRNLNILGLGFNSTANGQTIVPTQPFGKYFLGGKLLSLLCLSKEVCSQWKKLYGDTLVGFTTTSLYGNKDNRQTQYDNLVPYWDNCGSSSGKTPYKFNIRLENDMKDFAYKYYPFEYYRHFINRIREAKKRFYQRILRLFGFKQTSEQPRGVYYSRLYLESDNYLRSIIKIFEEVCLKEKVYEKKFVGKQLKSQLLIKKEQITEELKRDLWNRTMKRLEKELPSDDKLTPKFDNTIEALTNFWKFGKKGDTTKLPPDVTEKSIKRRGKQNLQKDTGMLKGRIDTSDLYKSEIQLTGKGFDTYDGLENLKWEKVFEKYS
jgi:hypothetical protein